jgi:dolichyl-phosphate beta-glucosyltransferase
MPATVIELPAARKTRAQPPNCTLVVPTYNAAAFIAQTVGRLREFVANHPGWLVLFACDGCSDDTVERLSAELAASSAALSIHSYPCNRGKGHALRRAMNLVRTPYAVYTDVDLAYDPDEALRLLRLLEDGADLAVANRVDPASRFLISPRDFPSIYQRHRMSRAFNWWLRHMLPIEILDTQAGLKGLSLEAWGRLAPHMMGDGFFFDVELLAWAGAMKMNIVQTPVSFRYIDPTTVKMVRHGWPMILETLRLRRRLKAAACSERAMIGVAGAEQ